MGTNLSDYKYREKLSADIEGINGRTGRPTSIEKKALVEQIKTTKGSREASPCYYNRVSASHLWRKPNTPQGRPESIAALMLAIP